ncbi:hypothetical protein BDQ17DRAFT_1248460 [Cyathus striatus]|nr:hypothetical protein BDQ17DRAFT_1248460 [Cyathus striatus]
MYDLLSFVLSHKCAYNRFTGDAENKLRTLYELDEGEWLIIKELCAILEILKEAMLFFSCKTPNLPNVIPVMDHINDCLTAATIDHTLPASIQTAAGLAKKTLNQYYSHTDESETYHISMILHPEYKLEYFKSAEWPEDWICTAKEVLHAQFELHYKKSSDIDSETIETNTINVSWCPLLM